MTDTPEDTENAHETPDRPAHHGPQVSVAEEMKTAIADVPGVKDLLVEQQIEIPQLQIKLNRAQLATHGVTSSYVNEFVETAMNGRTVSEISSRIGCFDLRV